MTIRRTIWSLVSVCVLAASSATADVSVMSSKAEREARRAKWRAMSKEERRAARKAARPNKPQEGKRARAQGSVGRLDTSLVDSSGLEWSFSTDTGESGSASDATYTTAVPASTAGGGTTTTTLSDAFDGYNGLLVNGSRYDIPAGGGTPVCGGREILLGPEVISGLTVTRRVFVPSNDTFARWLNILTNPGGTPVTVTVGIDGNMGSNGATTVETAFNGRFAVTNGDFGDPRVGHVLAGSGAPVPATNVSFGPTGTDDVSWEYDVTVDPGQTAIVMNFATGQGFVSQANSVASRLSNPSGTALDCMTALEISQVVNFNLAQQVPALPAAALLATALALAGSGVLFLRRRRRRLA